MDKNAIKKYAVWARRELIERVSQRAMIYGITANDAGDPNAESVNGHLLTQAEKRQRQALIRNIKGKGYEQVMVEAAYTWFNRFAALRFMEVNGYLPSHIRVFTNDAGEFKPQILAEAIHLEMEGLDMKKVYELENANKSDELFKYLLIVQCNALNSILPCMFQKIEDYTELLLPDYLLREGSVIEQMVTMIPEEDWTDQVQIIGWLYQYYNTEPKDKVFADLKKNIKITKESIPAATQLFTPDWIVHYMVENSLGRLWLEGHPNDALKSEWKYYLDEAKQEPEVEKQLAEIRKRYAALKPEEIKVIDPCCGSGHILCVLFDVLVRIYEDYGYTAREAAVKIIENNLWGLDIDERAAQLSYFAVMMKARQYDRRFFTRKIQPRVYAIHETNAIKEDYEHMKKDCELSEEQAGTLAYLMELFTDAKEYGSVIQPKDKDYAGLKEAWEAAAQQSGVNLWHNSAAPEIMYLIEQATALSQKYDVVVTNPPYMGSTGMGWKLAAYLKNNYPDSKSDLFAVFIERCGQMTKANSYQAMITQQAWMFLSSFEKLRVKLLSVDIVNMAHLGARAFEEIGGEVVQTSSFVIRKTDVPSYLGTYCRLVEPTTQQGKEDMFFSGENRFRADQSNFSKIPGAPVAYWVSEKIFNTYTNPCLDNLAQPRHGLATSDNARFLRLWYEVDVNKASLIRKCDYTRKWFPMNKGGTFRRWYGNLDWVVNYENNGKELKEFAISIYKCSTRTIQNTKFYFKESLTWSALTSGSFSVRWSDIGALFGSGGYSAFVSPSLLKYILALMNNKVNAVFIKIVSPTLNYEVGHIKTIPVLISDKYHEKVDSLVQDCISLSKADWDSFETSWDFKEHPFIASSHRLAKSGKSVAVQDSFEDWQAAAEDRFHRLKENEEELNRIFIDIYGLQDELTPDVAERDVTVHRIYDGRDDVPEPMRGSNYVRTMHDEIVSFISYAVGCMFGRYSLDKEGLIFAGGDWKAACAPDSSSAFCLLSSASFPPDKDAIIPICDDEYFEDDIAGRFVKFVETVFGRETLEENLRFIADALGGRGASREVIRNYFINDFYADHVKAYQKRPIYWLFDSGRKNGFKCLIYMHRYQPDMIARIRTDYVHEQQSRYRTAIKDLEQRVEGVSTAERVKLSKQLAKLADQAEELRLYEEKIHHLADQMIDIDLDDGVKVNYAKFADVLAKIR